MRKRPKRAIRSRELSFDAVVLGEKQSENAGGGFSDKAPGGWIVLKLLLPKLETKAKSS
jgi:hypothetical protein